MYLCVCVGGGGGGGNGAVKLSNVSRCHTVVLRLKVTPSALGVHYV